MPPHSKHQCGETFFTSKRERELSPGLSTWPAQVKPTARKNPTVPVHSQVVKGLLPEPLPQPWVVWRGSYSLGNRQKSSHRTSPCWSYEQGDSHWPYREKNYAHLAFHFMSSTLNPQGICSAQKNKGPSANHTYLGICCWRTQEPSRCARAGS